ncbi:hypothetical protein R8Z50_26660 [Longispora sp. K20-0274]|uniref:hypothetical protein n=1 Tax=Longispora sp. K20-0274 TaxID=3088255 RepID=UPI00399AF755
MRGDDRSRGPSREVHAAWRAAILVRVTQLRSVAARAGTYPAKDSPATRAVPAGALAHLDAAEKAARVGGGRLERFVVWWTGSDVEAAWLNLHAAEELLLRNASDGDTEWLAGVYLYARGYLGDSDPEIRYLGGLMSLSAGDEAAKTAAAAAYARPHGREPR